MNWSPATRASTGWLATAENVVKGGLATGGVITASALFSVTMTAVLQALPMVQALMLLGVYALLPMIVVLSRYSIAMMVVGAMAIFTIKFWSVLWYLAMWVDQNLIQSMYSDVNVFLQIFANLGEHDAKRMLLNMITTSPISGAAALVERDDGVGGPAHREVHRSSDEPPTESCAGCRSAWRCYRQGDRREGRAQVI